MTSRELEALRSEIDMTDFELIELLSRRADISMEIGLTKSKEGLQVRDRARERAVIGAFAKNARRIGVNDALAMEIARLLIADSVMVQSSRPRRTLEGKTAVVVGGSGRMGEWFCRFLSNRGAEVAVWDPRGKLSGYRNLNNIRPAASSDLVVVASPLGVAPDELGMVLALDPSGLVFDLCSVKSHIASQLRKAARAGLLVTSIHPMFGPRASSPRGRNVLVCDCGSAKAVKDVTAFLRAEGANVSCVDLKRHDELMAYVLGLSHLCSLLFAGTLRKSRKTMSELGDVQGPSFERMCRMSRELSSESKRVYHDIQSLNPNTRKVITEMQSALGELSAASLDADPGEFSRIMLANKVYLEVD